MGKKISQISVVEAAALRSDDVLELEKADGTSIQAEMSILVSSVQLLANIVQGTYTPTLTNVTNVASSTATVNAYLRIGSIVLVFGSITIDPTATGAIEVGVSLPVASAFSAVGDCAGTFGNQQVAGNSGVVRADTANARASFQANTPDAASRVYLFMFMYVIK